MKQLYNGKVINESGALMGGGAAELQTSRAPETPKNKI